ncbi:MAG: FliI/YscN family ATPase [Pseudomonadota bacterium]|nr:FliI/YscN family ATPase [Pseudomonadota bacterium]
MASSPISYLNQSIANVRTVKNAGRVQSLTGSILRIEGLSHLAKLGDCLRLEGENGRFEAQVIALDPDGLTALPERSVAGCRVGQYVQHIGPRMIAPDLSWLGRIIDPWGRPLDGMPLASGCAPHRLFRSPPPAATRRGFGDRLATGLSIFDTALPLVRGQRMGVFAGSGVGKSTLLGMLAKGVQADVRVIALIGERGRELGAFVRDTLSPEAMSKSVVIAATSDQSPLLRADCLPAAMTVAEMFRDAGQQVLVLADSITRFAEAYREVAIAAGEAPALRGFPASMTQALMGLAERAGPGAEGQADITALFTVLVAGSDMEEPIADLVRGTLDGHIVLDRAIAERGRYPAIDLLRSVSRSLPEAANEAENALIAEMRKHLGLYRKAEPMIRAGLHQKGADPALDRAISLWPQLDQFLAAPSCAGPDDAFLRLRQILSSR